MTKQPKNSLKSISESLNIIFFIVIILFFIFISFNIFKIYSSIEEQRISNRQQEILDKIEEHNENIELNNSEVVELIDHQRSLESDIQNIKNKKTKIKKNINDRELDSFFDARGF